MFPGDGPPPCCAIHEVSMNTDPIADLLIRLRNGALRGHETVSIPASRLKGQILDILAREGFVQGVERVAEDGFTVFKVALRYIQADKPMITGLRRISKPGRRVYVGKNAIEKVCNGIGISILSTSQGLMTDSESRRAGIGGEVLCAIW